MGKEFRTFINAEDIGPLDKAMAEATASWQEQDANDDILQQLVAHAPVDAEGRHEHGHERDCA